MIFFQITDRGMILFILNCDLLIQEWTTDQLLPGPGPGTMFDLNYLKR